LVGENFGAGPNVLVVYVGSFVRFLIHRTCTCPFFIIDSPSYSHSRMVLNHERFLYFVFLSFIHVNVWMQ